MQFFPEENLRKAEKFIKKAVVENAGMIVFPEEFITGSIDKEKEFFDSEHKYRKHFQKLAIKYRIDIIVGSIIEKDKSGVYNTSYYIDSAGKIKAQYRKINLWLPERKYFTAGKKVSVFETKFGKVGLIICWDLIFPEIFRKMVMKDVDIVVCPSYWCYGDAGNGIKFDANSEIKAIDSLCVARAFENEIVFVYCSAAGKFQVGRDSDILTGHYQITVPFKGVIKKLNHNREEMFIQEVDTAILREAEKAYEIRKDLRK